MSNAFRVDSVLVGLRPCGVTPTFLVPQTEVFCLNSDCCSPRLWRPRVSCAPLCLCCSARSQRALSRFSVHLAVLCAENGLLKLLRKSSDHATAAGPSEWAWRLARAV